MILPTNWQKACGQPSNKPPKASRQPTKQHSNKVFYVKILALYTLLAIRLIIINQLTITHAMEALL